MGEQEPGGLVPPYEGRQTEAKEGHEDHMDKVFDQVDEVPPGPGREISDEEREGVSATDMEGTSPLGGREEHQPPRRGRRQAGGRGGGPRARRHQGRLRPPARRLRRA